MISWKSSFEEISKDLELTKRKKQTLDDLLKEGKISQSTYESLNKDLTDAISEVEARKKAIAEKVTSKIGELEQQITVLETFLANSEIGYAAGEIDDELHQRETGAFALGLEATKQELDTIKEGLGTLMPEEPVAIPPTPPSEVIEETEIELGETLPEIAEEGAPEPEPVSEEPLPEQATEIPAEEALVEEEVEVADATPPETPTEMSPDELSEEAPAEEEELQPPEELIEETVEETVESYEFVEETAVEEAPAEEEAPTEEEEHWE